MNENVIKQICDKYSQKYNCIYNIKKSNTTDSVYIRFYFKDDKRFSVRISNHRKYNSKISSVKPTKDRLERILRKKFIKYEIYKIINFK